MEFFNRDAEDVALDLIGCSLARRWGGKVLRSRIIETEAYVGPHDLACHPSRGRTKRAEVMFGPPGSLYVYLVYGVYWMLNVVTGPIGYPATVLIRGVERIGRPGRLTKAFGITGMLNRRAATKKAGVWFELSDRTAFPHVIRSARVGVDYAGPVWAKKDFRFRAAER